MVDWWQVSFHHRDTTTVFHVNLENKKSVIPFLILKFVIIVRKRKLVFFGASSSIGRKNARGAMYNGV